MSAQPQSANRPDFEQSESFVGSLHDDPKRYDVRYLFSPFLNIRDNIQLTIGGFEWVRQGVLREVRNFTYSVPNPRDIEKAFYKRSLESPTLGRAPFQRSAADITEGWMRSSADIGGSVSEGGAPTGLVLLHGLQGFDSHRPDHRQFLEAVNELLWPQNFETADEHKAVLRNVDLDRIWREFPQDLIDGEPLMTRVERTVTQLLDEAIPKAETYCRRLYQELAEEFKGLVAGGETAKGARREAGVEVQRACRWLAIPAPVKPSNALDAIYTPGGAHGTSSNDAALSMIAQQVQQQGQVLEILAGKLVNNEPGTMEMFASFGDIMRSQQALLEKLAEKETVVVASAPAVAEEDEETASPKGSKTSASKSNSNKNR